MKSWEKYRKYLMTGEWHVHTTYTDGENTVEECCSEASALGIPLIAFTDHVRVDLDYDFNAYLSDIVAAREKFDIIILSGCEAKVLPGGELDVDKSILRYVDYPILAFHSFTKDIEMYIDSLKTALKNPYVCAWAHPGLFLQKNKFTLKPDMLHDILELMIKNRVLLELNDNYELPMNTWNKPVKEVGVELVRGSDVHNIREFKSELGAIYKHWI